MSQTAQNIINDVKEDWLNMPTTDTTTYTDANFLRLINKGQTDLGFLSDAQLNEITISTVDGVQAYALGATGVNPVRIAYAYIAGREPMTQTTIRTIAEDKALTTKGIPASFQFMSSDIAGSLLAEASVRFSPIPNGVHSVVVGVYTQPKKVTATGDTIYLDPVYTDTLKAQVAKYIFQRQQNVEMLAIVQTEIDKGTRNIKTLEQSKANQAYLSDEAVFAPGYWKDWNRSY